MSRLSDLVRLSITLAGTALLLGAASAGCEAPSDSDPSSSDPSDADLTAPDAEQPSRPTSAGSSRATTSFRAPLFFVQNAGQLDSTAPLYSQGRDATVTFGADGLTYSIRPATDAPPRRGHAPRGLPLVQPSRPAPEQLTVRFVGAASTVPQGKGVTPTTVNVFRGATESEWHTRIPTFHEVVYRDLWPGIDLVYSGESGQLKYSFVVHAGGNPADIRMAYRGASSVYVNEEGNLEVLTPTRTLGESAPITFQEAGGETSVIPSSFETFDPYLEGDHTVFEVGFSVGKYDTTKTLVIDPPAFVYAGFLGWASYERGLGITLDATGAAYVTGETTYGAGGDSDAYIAKVRADGTAYEWIGILGGNAYDAGYDIAVDSAGQAFITGSTASKNLPVGVGPDLTYNGGSSDCFVAKLNATGTGLIYSGYVGGKGNDFCEGVVVDGSGNAYITGPTTSNQSSMPVKVGPDLTFNGGYDTFVAKIVPVPSSANVLNNLVYLGYIGGANDDSGVFAGYITAGHIAIDSSGAAYVNGMTKSPATSFPRGTGFGATPGFDQTHGGDWDGFVVKVNPAGNGLDYATYVGGAGEDLSFGLKVDASGNAYFSGLTTSTEATLPVTVGPDLTYGGFRDAMIGKLSPSGTSMLYLGYIGGTGEEAGQSVALDDAGNVYIVGYADSNDGSFPAVAGPDLTENDAIQYTGDAFVCRMKPNPSAANPVDNYDYCGFIGGSEFDQAFWVAVDAAGNAYVAGDTDSTQATFPNGSGMSGITSPDSTANGLGDAFVVKVSP